MKNLLEHQTLLLRKTPGQRVRQADKRGGFQRARPETVLPNTGCQRLCEVEHHHGQVEQHKTKEGDHISNAGVHLSQPMADHDARAKHTDTVTIGLELVREGQHVREEEQIDDSGRQQQAEGPQVDTERHGQELPGGQPEHRDENTRQQTQVSTDSEQPEGPERASHVETDLDSGQRPVRGIVRVFAGECGGTLSLSSDHAQGSTDYVIRFNNFCMMDYSATPPGQTIIDGTLEGTEHGEPGVFGPLVSKATAKVDRLSVQAGGETTNISLSGLTVEFGNPGTWGPDEPTAENPDRITLERMTFDLASQDRVHTVSGLSARSWERENWDSVLDISTGRYSSSAGWHVDMATSEPLVANWDGELIAGSLELTGGGGDYVTVKPSPTNGGLLDMTLNGQPIEQSLDCREASEGLLGFLVF